jgi:serine/threonine protein kinase
LKLIARGSFATVYLVKDKVSGDLFAMKIYSEEKAQNIDLGFGISLTAVANNEIEILSSLDHPNIIQLLEVIKSGNQDWLCLVFELANDHILTSQKAIEPPMSEKQARNIFIQLVKGVEYMHKNSIIHCDIKPENLLFKDNVLKICDFGISQRIISGSSVKLRAQGTRAFFPPEMCNSNKEEIEGAPLDIWAMGVTLYYVVFGVLPFQGDAVLELYDSICNSKLTFPEKCSAGLRNLLEGMLWKDYTKRMTLKMIKAHEWLNI